MLTTRINPFLNIPDHLSKELEEDLLEFYAVEGYAEIPLIEKIIRHLTVHLIRFLNDKMLHEKEDEMSATEFSAQDLNDALENELFREVYYIFVKNIAHYYKKEGYFYESNWVFSDWPQSYNISFINPPLYNIW